MSNLSRDDSAGKKQFTLHLSADVLKSLTPNEQRLWTALLRIRDAATGELRFGDRWFDGKRFDREASMSPRTRQPVMSSLADKGLVKMEPTYAHRVIADRLTGHRRNRKVRTGFHYSVAESPREDWLSTKRQDEMPHKQRLSTKRQKEHSSTKRQSLPSARFAAAKKSQSLVGVGGQDVSDSGCDSDLKNSSDTQGEKEENPPALSQRERASLSAWLQYKLATLRARRSLHIGITFLRKDFLKKTNAIAIPFREAIALYESEVQQFRAAVQPTEAFEWVDSDKDTHRCNSWELWIVESYDDGLLMLPPFEECGMNFPEEPFWHPYENALDSPPPETDAP